MTPRSRAGQGKGFFGTIKALGVSLKDGIKLILKNRFLRTMLGLTLVSYLFSDPLIFNVLPEFAAGLIQGSSSMTAILNLPIIGWFFKGLISTPMGYFALMNVMASVGSIVATSLVKPLTKLFNKLGFKTEESLMVPFYIIAALEVPLFWLMIFSPSMLSVILLYGLQSFVLGFAGIAVAGVDQKVSGSFSKEDLPKVLAAQSFVGIVAAIISTLVYGFMLGNIAISTSLYIAAIATTVLGALRLAAPVHGVLQGISPGRGSGGGIREEVGVQAFLSDLSETAFWAASSSSSDLKGLVMKATTWGNFWKRVLEGSRAVSTMMGRFLVASFCEILSWRE